MLLFIDCCFPSNNQPSLGCRDANEVQCYLNGLSDNQIRMNQVLSELSFFVEPTHVSALWKGLDCQEPNTDSEFDSEVQSATPSLTFGYIGANSSIRGNQPTRLHRFKDGSFPRIQTSGESLSQSRGVGKSKLSLFVNTTTSPVSTPAAVSNTTTDQCDSWWTYSDDEEDNDSSDKQSKTQAKTASNSTTKIQPSQNASKRSGHSSSNPSQPTSQVTSPLSPKSSNYIRTKRRTTLPRLDERRTKLYETQSRSKSCSPSSIQDAPKARRATNISPTSSIAFSYHQIASLPHVHSEENLLLRQSNIKVKPSHRRVRSEASSKSTTPTSIFLPELFPRSAFEHSSKDDRGDMVESSQEDEQDTEDYARIVLSFRPEPSTVKETLPQPQPDNESCSSNSTFTPKPRKSTTHHRSQKSINAAVGTWTIRVFDENDLQDYCSKKDSSGFPPHPASAGTTATSTICHHNNSSKQEYRPGIYFEMKKKNRKNASLLYYENEVIQVCQELIDAASDKDELYFQVWTRATVPNYWSSATKKGSAVASGSANGHGATRSHPASRSGMKMIELGSSKILFYLSELIESQYHNMDRINRGEARTRLASIIENCQSRDLETSDHSEELILRPNPSAKMQSKQQQQQQQIQLQQQGRNWNNALSSWTTILQSSKSLLLVSPKTITPTAKSLASSSISWYQKRQKSTEQNQRQHQLVASASSFLVPLNYPLYSSTSIGSSSNHGRRRLTSSATNVRAADDSSAVTFLLRSASTTPPQPPPARFATCS